MEYDDQSVWHHNNAINMGYLVKVARERVKDIDIQYDRLFIAIYFTKPAE
jgi:hypothetical protein